MIECKNTDTFLLSHSVYDCLLWSVLFCYLQISVTLKTFDSWKITFISGNENSEVQAYLTCSWQTQHMNFLHI